MIPWTVACQAPLSMGFPRQKYWSGLQFPPPGDLPDPGIQSMSPVSPALAGESLLPLCLFCSLSNFEIHHPAVLTKVNPLNMTSPGFIYLTAGILYLLSTSIHFIHPPPHPSPSLATTNLWAWVFWFSGLFFFWIHIQVRAYNICLLLSDLSHLAQCPPGPPSCHLLLFI